MLASAILVYSGAGHLWSDHLERKLGQPVPSLPGYSLYVGFNMQHLGSYSTEDAAQMFDYLEQTGCSAQDAQEYMFDLFKDRISSGEVDFSKLLPAKFSSLLGHDEAGVFYSANELSGTQYSLLCVLSNVFYYYLLLLFFCGTYRLWAERRDSYLLLCPLYVLGLSLAQLLVEVAGRYHYSMIPALVIIAAVFFRQKQNKIPKTV